MRVADVITTGFVIGALTLGIAGSGLAQSPPPAPGTTPTPKTAPKGGGERHPHLRAALSDLRKAASQLEHADHDFGGHRAKALELVKQAEGELREALEWAKAHPDAGKR
jgi:hypothetical protein